MIKKKLQDDFKLHDKYKISWNIVYNKYNLQMF